jgi:hypothetical protein
MMTQIQQEEQVAKNRWTTKLGPLDWNEFLSRIEEGRTPLELQLYWKLLQRRLPVNSYLKSKNESSRSCPNCGELETIEHAFIECEVVQEFWIDFRSLLSKHLGMTLDEVPEVRPRDVVFCFPELQSKLSKEETYILCVCHSVALWAIWSSRNYDIDILWNGYLSRLDARIYLDSRRKPTQFQSTWCSGELVVRAENGYLFIDPL